MKRNRTPLPHPFYTLFKASFYWNGKTKKYKSKALIQQKIMQAVPAELSWKRNLLLNSNSRKDHPKVEGFSGSNQIRSFYKAYAKVAQPARQLLVNSLDVPLHLPCRFIKFIKNHKPLAEETHRSSANPSIIRNLGW